MGEGEIRRLWANVWLSPAVLPEEGPGAGFAEFCKGRNWAPTPTHARRHPAFGEFSKACKGTHTRTREEHPRFVRILTKRFNSLNNRVRILT